MTPEQIFKVRDARIIGVMGRAGSGKTTLTQRLIDQHPRVIRISFAKPLRMMVQALIEHTRTVKHPYRGKDYTDDPKLKEEPIPFLMDWTARQLMQTLGTEWARQNLDENFWVDIARGKMERALGVSWRKERPGTIAVVFDDVRFANEAAMIRESGGVIVEVVRPNAATTQAAGHASEQFDIKPDLTIHNKGSVLDLWHQGDVIWPPRKLETGAMKTRVY